MHKYRIISFDGGGVRGTLSSSLLKRLSQLEPTLINKTNMFAGTSTGAFLALGLAYGLNPTVIDNLYSKENSQFVFSRNYFNLLRPKYNNNNLKSLLASVFPKNLKLKDLGAKVVVPSFKLGSEANGSWEPVFFNNFPNSPYLETLVIDVALASSAAPVYFPSYKKYIDGAVIANNPSTAAIAIAKDEKYGKRRFPDLVLLSIGTGYRPQKITANTSSWGVLQWVLYPNPPIPILSVLTDGDVEADEYISSRLLGEKYFRLNPPLPHPIGIDSYNDVPLLKEIGTKYDLVSTYTWLEKNWS